MTFRPGQALPSFDAVILAGGSGSRLGGADKPGLTVGARTLAAAVAAAAAEAGAHSVIVVGPPRPELLPLTASLPGGLIVVREDPPGAGPVPALRCGLAEVRAPWAAVLAGDLPFLRACHLRELLSRAALADPVPDGTTPADAAPASPAPDGTVSAGPVQVGGSVLVDDDGRRQWLAGCWRTTALRPALLAYRGASLRGLMEPLRPVGVRCQTAVGQPPPWLDCDRPADLELARRLLADREEHR